MPRVCEHEECQKQSVFALEGETRGRWCKTHAPAEALNIVSKRCEHEGCQKQPAFALEGETKGRWCKTHAPAEALDVKTTRCEHEGCQTRACYGYPGRGLSRCGKREHRLPGMVKQPGKRCAVKGCSQPAIFGVTAPINCSAHRGKDERNLVHEKCESCGLPDLLDLKTSLCGDCAPETVQRAYLAKQRAVKATLDLGPHGDYSGYDERVERGTCGKERPDFWWDCGTHAVVLEVDENQHGGRPEVCECARMVNLSQSFGLPTHFIRYNPDAYKCAGARGKRTPGDSHAQRLDLLQRHLAEMRAEGPADRAPEKGRGFVTMTKLHFDGWTPALLGKAEVVLPLVD